MKRTLRNLQPGMLVGIANCTGTYTIIRREGRNLYRLDFDGREVVIPRVQLPVLTFIS